MRTLIFATAVVMAMCLVACGDKDDDTGSETGNEVVDTAEEETE